MAPPGAPGYPPTGYGQHPPAGYRPYPPAGYGPYPPAGYGQHPLQAVPAPQRRGRTFLLVALVVALMLGGGAAGYFLLGDSGGGEAAIDVGTADPEPDPASESESDVEDDEPPVSGGTLPVESLGAQVPIPGDQWELAFGPGESIDDISDAFGVRVEYSEDWIALFQVGQYAVTNLPYDSADLDAIAAELARFWAENASLVGQNGSHTDPVVTELTVDGRAAVLAEATASWEDSPITSDSRETVIVFLVDVDGVTALLGTAYVPESAESEYGSVLAAFEGTTFSD